VSRGKWVGGIIGGLVLVGIIGSCSGPGDVPRYKIESAVEKALSTDLTDPADSKFAPDSDVTISKDSDGDYEVSGYVDAANAFGGHVRNSYKAIVTKMDGDSLKVEWVLKNAITGHLDNGVDIE